MSESSRYVMCHVCTNSILLPDGIKEALNCDRCGHKVHSSRADSLRRTLAFSLTALIFYIPANLFPFMTFELYGKTTSSTIMGGVLSLIESGSLTVAIIVFLASIVIPVLKLVILFYLSLTARRAVGEPGGAQRKTRLYYFVEVIGRWSMLDIFLLAILVSLVKLGHWGTVTPEMGSLMFAMVVIFTMLASASFDPKVLWKGENDKA